MFIAGKTTILLFAGISDVRTYARGAALLPNKWCIPSLTFFAQVVDHLTKLWTLKARMGRCNGNSKQGQLW